LEPTKERLSKNILPRVTQRAAWHRRSAIFHAHNRFTFLSVHLHCWRFSCDRRKSNILLTDHFGLCLPVESDNFSRIKIDSELQKIQWDARWLVILICPTPHIWPILSECSRDGGEEETRVWGVVQDTGERGAGVLSICPVFCHRGGRKTGDS
jgi:hypothetical protein